MEGPHTVPSVTPSSDPESQKIVYIAGKMNGVKDFNENAFNEADEILTKLNFKTVNPHIINRGRDHSKEKLACMENDIIHITKCTHIHLLDGWESSRGVALELHLATYFKLKRLFLHRTDQEISWSERDL